MNTNPAATAAKPQPPCTPDDCPACLLPKTCDCETNLNTIIEAAEQFRTARALLIDIFGEFNFCDPHDSFDPMTFPLKHYDRIQVMKLELLDILPGKVEYIRWDGDAKFSFEAVKKVGGIKLTCLIGPSEAEELGLTEAEAGQ